MPVGVYCNIVKRLQYIVTRRFTVLIQKSSTYIIFSTAVCTNKYNDE